MTDREIEFVLASELRDGDELPRRGIIKRILNDSTVLTIDGEGFSIVKSQHAPIERYVRR